MNEPKVKTVPMVDQADYLERDVTYDGKENDFANVKIDADAPSVSPIPDDEDE